MEVLVVREGLGLPSWRIAFAAFRAAVAFCTRTANGRSIAPDELSEVSCFGSTHILVSLFMQNFGIRSIGIREVAFIEVILIPLISPSFNGGCNVRISGREILS